MQRADLSSAPEKVYGLVSMKMAELNGASFALVTVNPGGKWSNDIKPHVGTDSCEREHIGFILSGTLAVRMNDGSEEQFSKNHAMMVPPGHDAWCVGEEPAVFVEFARKGV